ncbi:MAG: sortase [Chloroflexota bacterium]|nr:MAG: sortase [Chloroflexota bacterium]
MSKQTLRFLGALLALTGSLILAYAAYSYVSQKQLEAALTAKIPGQSPNTPLTTTPVVIMPVLNGQAVNPQTIPTIGATHVSPSVTPFPTHATPVQPDATSVIHVVGTATAISLAPRTPRPTEPADYNTRSDQQTATRVPTVILAGVNVPTPVNNAPVLDPSADKISGTPRGTGAPAARLQIPKLNMDLAVATANYVTFQQNGQLVSDWNVPFDSAGHLATTAQPGEIGNAVISGHHNLTAPNTFGLGAFAGLWNLIAGDEIRVNLEDGKTQLWRVTESFPVKEGGEPLSVRIEHAQQIMGDTNAPLLTLLTCWNGKSNPLSGNTYRWVIRAELVNVN